MWGWLIAVGIGGSVCIGAVFLFLWAYSHML